MSQEPKVDKDSEYGMGAMSALFLSQQVFRLKIKIGIVMSRTDQINKSKPASGHPVSTGSNPGNLPFSTDSETKQPMSQTEIDRKISESTAGESGDDIRSEKYKKKDQQKKQPDEGPNFDQYSDQEDGDTSANAGVFK